MIRRRSTSKMSTSEALKHAPLLHEHHAKPRSRRDFLGQGLLAGLGYVCAPTVSSMLLGASTGFAAECNLGVSVNPNALPFLCFDLAGGANMCGSNVMVGGAQGQLDFLPPSAYAMLGLPGDMTPDKTGTVAIGDLHFHPDSAFFRGITQKASAVTLANTTGTVVCARSNNDTGNNPHNPMYGIVSAGGSGQLVAAIGNRDSVSGGRSRSPDHQIDLSNRPVKVSRPRDATGLVDAGKMGELFGSNVNAVMQATERLSQLKLDRVVEDQLYKDIVACGYLQASDTQSKFSDPMALDILSDADNPFDAQEMNDGKVRRTASVMKLVMDGYATCGTVEFGGYDYHNGTRSTGEVRDEQAGVCIGAALEFAARKNVPCMLYICSDGSLDSRNESIDDSVEGRGKLGWRGDNSSTGGSIMLVYNPNGAPMVRSSQIGYFKNNGSLERSANAVSDNVDALADMCVLNYLALLGRVGEFAQVMPEHKLGNNLDELIAFGV